MKYGMSKVLNREHAIECNSRRWEEVVLTRPFNTSNPKYGPVEQCTV